jgi:hypothetical protein
MRRQTREGRAAAGDVSGEAVMGDGEADGMGHVVTSKIAVNKTS